MQLPKVLGKEAWGLGDARVPEERASTPIFPSSSGPDDELTSDVDGSGCGICERKRVRVRRYVNVEKICP